MTRPYDTPTPTWLACITDGIASYRLTRLLVEDRITRSWRTKVQARYGETSMVGYLVECPWCVSLHVGILVVCARFVAPKLWAPLAKALAFSAVTGLISEHS